MPKSYDATPDDPEETVAALLYHYADELTPWELQEFLPSLRDQLERGRLLSEKQRKLLDRIYERASRGGSYGGKPA